MPVSYGPAMSIYAAFWLAYGGASSTSASSVPGIDTRSVSIRNCFNVGNWVRASATGPSGDFAASICCMHSPSAAPGANFPQAERKAS